MEMISHSIPQGDDAFSDLLIEVPKTSLKLHIAQLVSYNLGSACYLIGSTCFYSRYSSYCMGFSCELMGPLLFIMGSLCWALGSVVSHLQSRAYSTNRGALIFNSIMLIFGCMFLCVGSLFLIPSVAILTQGYHVGGIVMFIVGCLLLAFANGHLIYRAARLVHMGHIEIREFLLVVFIGLSNIVGSVCFILASMFRLSTVSFQDDSIAMSLSGSIAFLVATLASPFAVSVWVHKVETIGNDKVQEYAAVVGESTHSYTTAATAVTNADEDYVFVG